MNEVLYQPIGIIHILNDYFNETPLFDIKPFASGFETNVSFISG